MENNEIKKNTKKYKENKLRYIPKCDKEMLINDKFEQDMKIDKRKYKK